MSRTKALAVGLALGLALATIVPAFGQATTSITTIPVRSAGLTSSTSITGALTWPDNTRQTFNPGADAAGLNVGSHAGDPGTPSNGDLWYDSSAGELTARIAGASVALGAAPASVTTIADKTATETVNNSAILQDDDDLTFACAADKNYRFDAMLIYSSTGATPDLKLAWSLPASAAVTWSGDADAGGSTSTANSGGGWGARDSGAGSAAALSSGTLIIGTSANNPRGVVLRGVIDMAGTAGTCVLQWAQNTQTSENTSLLAGSNLIVTLLN